MPDELKTLIAAWHAAWFARDAAAIARMMAEDYVYVAPNGAILDRPARDSSLSPLNTEHG